MARRKMKKTRRRKPRLSLTNTAQGLIVGNAFVKGATNANLFEFFTGRVSSSTYLQGVSAYNPTTKDAVITLPELLGIDRKRTSLTTTSGGTYNQQALAVSPSLQLEQMRENVMANGLNMIGTAIVVPIAFKVGKQVATKAGVRRGVNKLFDVAGLKEVRF